MPMKTILDSKFSTINADFKTVKGSRGRIYYDKNNKIAILILKADKDTTQNYTEIIFNAKNISKISKGKRDNIFENIFLAIYMQGKLKVINLNKLIKGIVPETLISAIEKSERHIKPNSKSRYHKIKYNYSSGYIEVDKKRFKFPVADNKPLKQKPANLKTQNNQRPAKVHNTKQFSIKQKHKKPIEQTCSVFSMSWKRRPSTPQKHDNAKRDISIFQAGIRILLSTG